ncbi:hypothetical protein EW026_g3973 [Hermanssonia centrifuga]|uniref:Uncharacterized protein n=1 Tax=Hermanssonia centrifuga TaxID=98765 RepID=A0A4S4KKE7_9APHY|nr:hypothetical protein EW026_g3973 [Hermanssonia centrifuga]
MSDSRSVKSLEKASISETPLQQYDPDLVEKTWRKVDLHVMPISVMLYLASYIDRANIGNAKVLGLSKDLGLTNNQYNLALSIFFAGYVVFETPSNIIIKRTSPRWYIPTMTWALGTPDRCKGDALLYSTRQFLWIFIVEGCITAGMGLLAFIFMTSNPATAKFLSPTEREIVARANEADRALKSQESFSSSQIRSAFTDWRTVVLSLPTVVTGLGYSGVVATLMATPPYGLGFVVVLVSGWTVDRYGYRFLHYVVGISVTMIALIILMAVENLVVRYVMFFFIMFMFIPISVMWAWLSSNVAGSNKRAAATGVIFSVGNVGGIISGQIYRAEWAPRYVQGHAINLACYVIALVAGFILWLSYRNDNIARDKAEGRRVERTESMLGDDLGDLGDRHPHFRYYL